MNLSDLGVKVIGMKSLTYKNKEGKRITITAKKEPKLFKKLNAILKKAEKDGALWEVFNG